MYTRGALVLLSIVSVVAVARAAPEVKHLQINEGQLIETSPSNFAVSTPLLAQNGWNTVSVNGNKLLVVSQQCQQTIKTMDSLNQQEQAALLSARQQLSQVELGQGNLQLDGVLASKSGSTTYSLIDHSHRQINAHNINLSTLSKNGQSITNYGDDSFSVSRPDLPNNLARFFFDKVVATFVYKDGQVMMRPVGCLQPQELQLAQQVKQEAQEAQGQFQAEIPKFNQSTAEWQQDFQEQMEKKKADEQQNLNQNPNGMFNSHQPYEQYQPYYLYQPYYSYYPCQPCPPCQPYHPCQPCHPCQSYQPYYPYQLYAYQPYPQQATSQQYMALPGKSIG